MSAGGWWALSLVKFNFFPVSIAMSTCNCCNFPSSFLYSYVPNRNLRTFPNSSSSALILCCCFIWCARFSCVMPSWSWCSS
jgi:hypothetical protein